MTLLNPTYLWGLLALGVPIAIHLWSKKKVQTIKVGSTQFIDETQSKQHKSIRPNEWWLLLLRCLALATLVLILTEPRLTVIEEREDITYIFEPSLLASGSGLERFKNIPEEHRRLLVSGLPHWEKETNIKLSEKPPNYWQLAKEMERLAADSIVVFTNALAQGLQGKRPSITASINWVTVGLEQPVTQIIEAKKSKDHIELIEVQSDGEYLAFAKAKRTQQNLLSKEGDSIKVTDGNEERWISLRNETPIRITIVHDQELERSSVYLEAAFKAIGVYLDREVVITKVEYSEFEESPEAERLVWLSKEPIASQELSTLVYQPDPLARGVIVDGLHPKWSYLTTPLTVKNTLDSGLSDKLMDWLQLHRELEEQIISYDKRTVAIEQLLTKDKAEEAKEVQIVKAESTPWFWMLFGFLLVSERILAKYRKQ